MRLYVKLAVAVFLVLWVATLVVALSFMHLAIVSGVGGRSDLLVGGLLFASCILAFYIAFEGRNGG